MKQQYKPREDSETQQSSYVEVVISQVSSEPTAEIELGETINGIINTPTIYTTISDNESDKISLFENENNGKSIVCNFCEHTFTTKTNLENHIISSHKIKWIPSCKQNEIISNTVASEKQYQEDSRDNLKKFVCKQCNYYADRVSRMRSHVEKKHTNVAQEENWASKDYWSGYEDDSKIIDEQYSCSECSFVTSESSYLRNHEKIMHEPQVKSFLCSNCGFKFKTKGLLKRHTKSVHLKIKPFVCGECNFRASYKVNLKTHIQQVHENIKKFECQSCEYKTAWKPNLNKHFKVVHLKLKAFACDECDFRATQKAALDIHSEDAHGKIKRKKFECPDCNFIFNYKSNLNSHINQVHLKFKKFQCHSCEYKTAFKPNLNKHFKVIHLKIKPYACRLCDFTAARNDHLREHKKEVH